MVYPALLEQGVKNALSCVGMKYSQARRMWDDYRDCSSLIARAMIQAGYEYGCAGRPVPRSLEQVYEDGYELIYPANDAYNKIGKSLPTKSSVLANAGLMRGDVIFVGWESSSRANNIEHVVLMYDDKNIVHARGTAWGVRKDKATIYADKVCAITRFNPLCDLVVGHYGNRVRVLQKALNNALKLNLKVDGQFGSNTRSAVLKFQASIPGMPITGKGDKATRAALGIVEKYSTTTPTLPAEDPAVTTLPTLKMGAKGEYVKYMQNLLLLAGEKLPEFGADSDFGQETHDALVSFQKKQGIASDGVCGPVTWNHLKSDMDDGGEDAELETDHWRVRVNGKAVNLRDKPDATKGVVRGVVFKDAILKSTGSTLDNWFNVVYNGESLWVSGNYNLTTLYSVDEEEPVQEPEPIDPARVEITDMSKWNGKKYVWAEYKKVILFQILRISCGMNKDSLVDYLMKNAIEQGIPTYVYMFTYADNDLEIAAETKKMLEYLAPYKDFVLGVFLDAEVSSVTRSMGSTFVKLVRNAGYKRVGFYIAHHLYRKMNLDVSEVDIIWIPNYGKNTGSVSSTPSFFCHLHQYTSKGKVKGCGDSTVDKNRIMPNCGKTPEWFISLEAA
jgi:GH25 family lysozyme M1 (1,4-beta-N-acetylmuramidase)